MPLADYTAGGEFHPASKTCISSLAKAYHSAGKNARGKTTLYK
jgi:hypothetical protein